MCNKAIDRRLIQLSRCILLSVVLALAGWRCARTAATVEVTGYGAPEYHTAAEGKRLTAYQAAREDAWTKLFDVVRAQPEAADTFLGDRLSIDERLRARVLNSVHNAKVLRQHYDPRTERAEVVLRYDLDQLRRLRTP